MSSNVFKKMFDNGSIYHINFGKTFHPELKSKHLGILFQIDSCENMVLCLPMTSPKPKHFNTLDGYKNRDFRDLKYPHIYYIKQTDSIVLFEQFKCISKARIESAYKDSNKKKIILLESEQIKLKKAFNKFFKDIIKL